MLNRRGALKALFPAAGSYGFFALQFLVPTQEAYDVSAWVFRYFGVQVSNIQDEQLFVAMVFFSIYVALILIAQIYFSNVYNRLSMRDRLFAFESDIINITRYHDKQSINHVFDDVTRHPYRFTRENATRLVLVMLDLTITDLRDALQRLCVREDIKVALFLEALSEENPVVPEKVLKAICTTEFNVKLNSITTFRKPRHSREYQGFCGYAWSRLTPSSGTYRYFGIRKDRRYFAANPRNKLRSFLCLPLKRVAGGIDTVEAILSIDSGWKYDFVINRDLRSELDIITKSVQELILNYIDLLKLIE